MSVNILVRWADNTPELVRNLKEGTGQIEATRASVAKLAESLGGDKLIAAAHRMVAAIGEIGGAETLTNAQRTRTNKLLDEAIQKYTALGKTAPAAMVAVFEATKKADDATGGWTHSLVALGTSWTATIASGQLLANAIQSVLGTVVDLAKALPELALQGAAVADVEENFKRLTAQTGRLGETLLGTLKTGTHNTITDFNLMKLANQDLAAGMNLTDKQFGTLAKGAFALAQATGTDVKTGLDTMNDAMLTGRTRALALLTGKIDLVKAEEDYAKSLGSTTEHLTAEGKLEAARVAILKAVGDATERLGEQTDGLDERVAQAAVAWENFKENLGKTIATSKVLESGMDGLAKAIADTFGASQKDLIDSIAKAVDDAAIALVSLAKIGVETGGVLATEWYALYKVFGDVAQIIQGNVLAFEYLALGVAKATAAVNLSAEGQKKAAADVKRIDDNIQSLLVTMKARGDALQDADRKQAGVSAATDKYVKILDDLQAKMSAARSQSASYGVMLDTVTTQQTNAGTATARTTGMLQASKEELAKAKKAQEDYAKAVERYNSTDGPSYLSILDKIGNEMYEGIAFDKARGKSTEDLILIYKTTSTVIDQVVKSEKDAIEQHKILEKVLAAESTALSANVKEWENLGTAVKGQQQAFEAFGKLYERLEDDIRKSTMTTTDYQVAKIEEWRAKELAALNHSIDGWQIHEQRIKETAQKEIDDLRYAQESITAMLARISAEQDRAPGKKAGNAFVEGFDSNLQQMPSIIQRAFEGGGGAEGAAMALGVSLADSFIKAYADQLTRKGVTLTRAQKEAVNLGSVGGAAIGGAVGGAGGSLVGGLASSVGGAGLAASGAFAGSVAGAVALGAATAGIGAAAVGVYLLAKRFLTVSQNEKDARIEFQKLQALYGSLPATIAAVGKAYEETGHTAEEAQAALKRALDATHKSAAEEQSALKPIADILAQAEEKGKKVSTAFEALTAAGRAFGGTVPDAFKDAIRQLATMKGITDEQRIALLAMTKDVKPNFEELTATAAKYGVTLEGLGKSFQQANIEGRAKQISGDFEALTKAGGDVGGILLGMSDEISQLVQDSKRFGTSIPENMRPLIENLLAAGKLVDANGDALTDLAGLSFEDTPLDDSISSLTDAIKELIAALTGVPVEIDKINKKPIKIPIETVPGETPIPWPAGDGSGLPPGAQTAGAYRGGLVTQTGVQYLAAGGKPKGTDTVPAMLTPGERVLSVTQTKAYQMLFKGPVPDLPAWQGPDFLTTSATMLRAASTMLEAAQIWATATGTKAPPLMAPVQQPPDIYIDFPIKSPIPGRQYLMADQQSSGMPGFLAGDNPGGWGTRPYPSFAMGSGGFQDFGTGTLAVLHGQEAVVTPAQMQAISTITNNTSHSSESATFIIPVVAPPGATHSQITDLVIAALPDRIKRNVPSGLHTDMKAALGLPVTTWTR